MKKLLALLLVLAMVFSVMTVFTACEDSSSSSSDRDDDDDDKDDDDKDDKDDEDEDDEDELLTPGDEDDEDDKDDEDDEDEDEDDDKDDDKDDEDDEDKDDKDDDDDDDNALVGEWVADVDMACVMNMMFEQSMDEEMAQLFLLDSFVVGFTIEFTDDGEYEMIISERDFEKEMEDAAEIWVDAYYELIEQQLEIYDLDMTVEEYAEQALGCSVEEFIEEALVSGMDSSQFENEGDYELDGNKLYMDSEDTYYTINLDGDELEFEKYSEGGIDDELLKGVVFERQ